MLTMNCDFFNQVMMQHLMARQYNDGARALFAIALRSHRAKDELFGHNPIQLAIVYVYDVGITNTAVTAFCERAISEIARTDKKLAFMKMHSPEEREEILYRRAMHERTFLVPEDDAWDGDDSDSDSMY